MIQEAPYFPDLAQALRRLALEDFPVLFASDPNRPDTWSRFSILTAFPLLRIVSASPTGAVSLLPRNEFQSSRQFRRLKDAVGAALAELSPSPPPPVRTWAGGNAPFTGGLAGYVAYEYGGHFDRMPRRFDVASMPLVHLGLYGAVYIADHRERRGWWATRRFADPHRGYGEECLERLQDQLGPPAPPGEAEEGAGQLSPGADWRDDWSASLSQGAYASSFERIQGYLRAGDVYQVNLTVRFRRPRRGDPRVLFEELQCQNPAPFGAFLGSPEGSVLSSSPELLLDVTREGEVETRPIKGTIGLGPPENPGGSPDSDAESTGRRLLASAKDRAEHIMIVDLERNDLGKVCRPGSVRVEPLLSVEAYRGLQHLVSSVRGRLRPGLGALDAFAAVFPGGSISGAPKVRALEIIRELEPVPRGVYTGALGWISPEGEARMSLAIRTLIQHRGVLDLHVGGGIVIDSAVEAEWEECRLKGEAMDRAVRRVEARPRRAAGSAQ